MFKFLLATRNEFRKIFVGYFLNEIVFVCSLAKSELEGETARPLHRYPPS